MTDIQHRDIPDAQLHEPKGVAAASTGYVYVANGVGSGTWKKVGTDSFKGISGDGGSSNKKLVSDGSNGFSLREDVLYGAQTITSNNTVFAVTAVADTTFNTASQFSLLTGPGAPWTSENLFGVAFDVDRLTVPVSGIYEVHTWMNITVFPNASARVAVRYRVNGSTFSLRKPTVKSAIANDISQVTGFGLVSLNAGDYIQMYVASDTTGNLVIGDCSHSIKLIRQTA